ncbi:MAG: sulfotransferase [Balneolaceae bacterium]|nr:sulfotransferase [Balneolaceae bacterium]
MYRNIRPRKVHVYCTGTPKSGTHSIAYMFKKQLRSQHEPARDELISIFRKKQNNHTRPDRIKEMVYRREQRLHLDVNSSCFNHIIVGELVELFPDAKFVHPVRSPRDWLESWINHEINHQTCTIHQKFEPYFDKIFNKSDYRYRKDEHVLKELGLPTIEGMLSYWNAHNSKILETVPEDRLMVLRTKEISEKKDSILQFLGLNSLDSNGNTHAYKAVKKHDILSSIDSKYLNAMIARYDIDLEEWL